MDTQKPRMKTIQFDELKALTRSINKILSQEYRKLLLYRAEISDIEEGELFKAGNISLSSELIDQHLNEQIDTLRPVLELKNLIIEVKQSDIFHAYYSNDGMTYGYHLILDNVTIKNESRKSLSFIIEINRFGAMTIINHCNFEEANLNVSANNIGYSNIEIRDSVFDSVIINGLINNNPVKQLYNLLISENKKIGDISIYNQGESFCKLKLINGNKIGALDIDGTPPEIYSWGAREKFIPTKDKEIIEKNRKMLMKLRKEAIESGDKLHQLKFENHINEFNQALINLKDEGYKLQDKITMFIGKYLSNHGTSWLQPAFIFIVINLLIAWLVTGTIFVIEYYTWRFSRLDSFYIFFELFNPFNTVNKIVEEAGWQNPHYAFFSLLTLINKLAYSICGYEFIRAARRFTMR